MELAIALVLVGIGAAILAGGYRAWKMMVSRAAEIAAEQEGIQVAPEATGSVGPDGLVCLFAHEFVRPVAKTPSGRDRAYAPLTDQELDPEDFALQLLYALTAELFAEGRLDFRLVPREPTYMPPFPQKAWELQVRQLDVLEGSPLAKAMAVAFELLTGRKRRRRGRPVDDEEGWVALDDLVDRMLRAIRQELSFWERTGVYGDLRSYVEDALAASGYLFPPERVTWLDRVRSKRPRPNVEAIGALADEARALRLRLAQFRRRHGSQEAAAAIPEDGPLPITDVDPHLMDSNRPLGELPLDDCLRASLYEALTALRQLEPSSDAGV
ncbi:MAG: hypothetical protein N2512_07310 [Armatimonadetes bacterium]|nr:hypothetical protein [Armatimonadota bacterium]